MAARKPGRKCKLTPELQAEMEQLFATGVTIKTACDYVGISQKTYETWMNKGQTAKSGQFFDFYGAIKKAQSVPLTESVAIVRKAARPLFRDVYNKDGNVVGKELVNGGSWQAAAWILERKDPANYAKRTYLKVEGLDDFLKWCERKGETPGDLFQELMQSIEAEHASSDVKRD